MTGRRGEGYERNRERDQRKVGIGRSYAAATSRPTACYEDSNPTGRGCPHTQPREARCIYVLSSVGVRPRRW